jgi:hypothetical protein
MTELSDAVNEALSLSNAAAGRGGGRAKTGKSPIPGTKFK